jgi:hypothetical protein
VFARLNVLVGVAILASAAIVTGLPLAPLHVTAAHDHAGIITGPLSAGT